MNGNTVEQPARRCVIVSACPVSRAMRRYLRPGDRVIACDAGYRNLEALGCRADLIVGDFDSAPQPQDQQVVVLPHVKDDTDTHYAALQAVQMGMQQVVLLGALGGPRMEHTLANLATGLFLQKQGICTVLADEHSELHYLLPQSPLCLDRQDWQYFSLFPLEGVLEGVDIQGAFYPLQNARLTADYPLGVSNEFTAPQAVLRCKAGSGIVVLTRE